METKRKSYKKLSEEYLNDLKRVQAEFENYKKRIDKEVQEYKKYATESFIVKLLPILDSFQEALKHHNDEGLKLIYNQFYSTLKKEGLQEINCVNEKFDPYKHEVLMQEHSDKDSMIIEEFQKGYILNGKVIRHSKVKVGKKDETK